MPEFKKLSPVFIAHKFGEFPIFGDFYPNLDNFGT